MTKENSLPSLPCACASLRRAARAVTQLYDDEMRTSGLKATQFTILQVLSTRGESRQSAIGETLALDATTLTRTMKLLSREGWVESRTGKFVLYSVNTVSGTIEKLATAPMARIFQGN